ncbi:conserved hypothetical protein [Rippkaea orientalis PCC 8801]|uniref:DUF3887 domain-containing protein n=1 Tax=Rippkaea orientalis (strain PCC 8801 / RF-1) TaxID=41431 RepID=B7JW49_RIPO1|nr:DUF3887 domain-containing protein [Rippkaea orientalis]ACK65738.1 conserved hypothetical protein [Rippkaea orientalis PCC 8801]
MNKSLSLLKRSSISFLGLAVLTIATELPAKAQRLTPPPAVQVVQSTTEVNKEALANKASEVITLLSQEKYEEARKLMSPALSQELTVENMKEIWQDLITITGPIKKQGDSRVISTVNSDLVSINTEFTNKTEDFIVVFNKEGQVVGIDFPQTKSVEEIAQTVVNAVAQNNFAQARGYLHPFLKTELFPQQIRASWESIQQRNGSFEKIVETEVRSGSSVDKVDVVVVEAQFQKANQKIFFIFDENGRITGIDLTQ